MKQTKNKRKPLTFIDLFAGIGGIRLAFERAGAQCVFSSEWDPYACKTYEANFGEIPHGDVTQIEADDIPNHDILTAGFPCQPFSIAGVSKHNALGNAHGFRHATQGTLFFDVARIIEAKQPRAFMLENVKNLLRHDGGKTFAVIRRTLEVDLGYTVSWKVLDAKAVVPQHRERVFIVGFKDPVDFEFPDLRDRGKRFAEILDPEVDSKYILTANLWQYLRNYAAKHKAKGNGFGYGMVDLEGFSRTLSARYYKDGSEILIPRGARKRPRRLTPRECARLMGFPDSFKIVCSDTRAYKQFGNSVVVPVVEQVAKAILPCLEDPSERRRGPRQMRLLEKPATY
ncbi:MAG TPA: DNA (cytosine-5-)-methyltransferase [Candidatus Krumholzibacteria bacterium]|nr:DNA (cytosine-5-)-methyltransferase [Candidatus Krumholzibacteria bacterium]